MSRRAFHWALLMGCSFLLLACAGGIQGKVNSSKKFESKWTIRKKGLAGGTRTIKADLKVDGKKWAVHQIAEYLEVTNAGPIKMITESDIVCDGTAIWQFNRKSKIEGYGEFTPEPGAIKYVPEEEFDRAYWRIPSRLTMEEKGSEKIDGDEFQLWEARTWTALGTEGVYQFLVDPDSHYIRQSKFGYTEGAGGRVQGWEREYVCTEYSSSPSFDGSEFKYSGDGEVTEVNSFEF